MYSESMEEFKGSYEQGIDLTGKLKGLLLRDYYQYWRY